MPQGPQPSSSILVFTVPAGKYNFSLESKLFQDSHRESKSNTWVKSCDDDFRKVESPVGGEHATAELGVRVGGVGGEGGLFDLCL